MIQYMTVLAVTTTKDIAAQARQLIGVLDILTKKQKEDKVLDLLAQAEAVQFAYAQILASAGPPTDARVTDRVAFHRPITENNINHGIDHLEKLLEDIESGTEAQQRGHLTHVVNDSFRVISGLEGVLKVIGLIF